MCTIKDFKQWVKDDICRRTSFEDIVEIVNEGIKDIMGRFKVLLRIRIYTNTTCYVIYAVEGDEETDSYLGCVASSRKPRAGEDWTRKNDLPDGSLLKKHGIRLKTV